MKHTQRSLPSAAIPVKQGYQERLLEPNQPFPADVFIRDSRQERLVASPHWHDCLELLYLIEGRAVQRINSHTFTLQPGDLVILREGDVHATNTEPDEIVRILVVKFLPHLLSDAYARQVESIPVRAFLSQRNPSVLHIRHESGEEGGLRKLLDALFQEWTQKRPAHELAVHGLLYCIIAELTRMGSWQAFPSTLSPEEQRRLAELLQQVVDRLPAVMTLREAAETMRYSYSHFSRRFLQMTGQSFKTCMDTLRVREAERFVLQEGLSLRAAAARTGFADAATFSRTYKRIRGICPRDALGLSGQAVSEGGFSEDNAKSAK